MQGALGRSMDIRLEEFLVYLPLVGSALLIIGSKIYGIKIPKDEEISIRK